MSRRTRASWTALLIVVVVVLAACERSDYWHECPRRAVPGEVVKAEYISSGENETEPTFEAIERVSLRILPVTIVSRGVWGASSVRSRVQLEAGTAGEIYDLVFRKTPTAPRGVACTITVGTEPEAPSPSASSVSDAPSGSATPVPGPVGPPSTSP